MNFTTLKSIPLIVFMFTLTTSFSQDKVKWAFEYDNQSSTVFFTAELKEHWHLYSQYIDENLGPIPTTFEFIDNENVSRVGVVKENNVKTIFDENFGGNLEIIEGKAVFSQEIVLKRPTTLKGTILFMLCDDKGCLPPDVKEFEIEIN
jgi:hypothetical protein